MRSAVTREQLGVTVNAGRIRVTSCDTVTSSYPAGADSGSCITSVSSPSFYTVAVCDCVLHQYDFLFFCQHFLSTLLRLISPTGLDRFWPALVTSTDWPLYLCHMTRSGSKVTKGSQESKSHLDPSTKFTGLEIQPGSFGVTEVKRSFFPENVITHPCYIAWP